MGAHGYALVNAAGNLAASAFGGDAAGATRSRLNDGHMDRVFSLGALTSSGTITIDFGSAVSLVGIGLLNNNLATATAPTVTIQGATDSGFTTSLVTAKAASTPATTKPRHKDHAFIFPAVSKRYWRVQLAWTGLFTFTLGELFAITTLTSLSRRSVYGSGESEEFRNSENVSDTGERRSRFIAGPIRSKRLDFVDNDETSKDELMTLWRGSNGGASSLLWVDDINQVQTAAAAADQQCLFGKVQSQWGWSQTDYGLFTMTALELRSQGREMGA